MARNLTPEQEAYRANLLHKFSTDCFHYEQKKPDVNDLPDHAQVQRAKLDDLFAIYQNTFMYRQNLRKLLAAGMEPTEAEGLIHTCFMDGFNAQKHLSV